MAQKLLMVLLHTLHKVTAFIMHTSSLFSLALRPVFVVLLTCFSASAFANLVTLDITWDGSAYGNSATATGVLVFDDALLPNIESNASFYSLPNPGMLDLSITVSGASSGNGSFSLSDYNVFTFSANAPLDFSQELIGQTLAGGCVFGDAFCSDFNLQGNSNTAPFGTWYFEMQTDGGTGDVIGVTSMKARVPLPGTVLLFAAGLLGLGWSRDRMA